jgi:uncharacterized repeat protein (TIGR03803 family)
MKGEEVMNYKKFLGAASAALIIVILVTLVLSPGAWAQNKYKTLYKFKGGKDGVYPTGRLIFDAAGDVYGTTESGGAYGIGTVFELTPNPDGSWTKKVLHHFTGGKDGASPYAGGVSFDQAGNLYGTTSYGGTSGGGTVFELSPNPDGSWSESVLYAFGADGWGTNGPLTIDAGGNLYGVQFAGGSGACGVGCGSVFELSPNSDGSWTKSRLHTFNGKDGSNPETGVIFDAAGNLYGTTVTGGKCVEWGCGVVYKLTPNSDGTWSESLLYRFCTLTNCRDGQSPYSTLTFDQAGNLYGSTTSGGAHGMGTVFELSPNSDGSWTEKVLHHFTGGRDGADVYGAGVVLDHAGNLYSATFQGGNLSDCDGAGCGVAFKLAPNSTGGWHETVLHAFAGHPGANPVSGLTFDTAGNLYGTTSGSENWGQCSGKRCGSVFEITP